MAQQISRVGELHQADAADGIAKRFGQEWIYENDNGNPAVDRRVLKAFRRVTGDTVVWDWWEFCWRRRSPSDAPGRKQE
jgi:hypothetical protein